jgi:pSer/pThr/pTyr-binding forkhead associated (FHA) protein
LQALIVVIAWPAEMQRHVPNDGAVNPMDVKLVMFKTSGSRKDFSITNPVTVLGRGEKCDLRVPIVSVSRRHCELTVGDDEVTVKDLASSNGTYVNNQRITETQLNPGDRLVVGPIVFTVQIDGEPSEIQPVKTRGQVMAEEGKIDPDNLGDLEAEIVAQPGASGEATAIGAASSEEDDDDPIAALEALAADVDLDEDEDENS